MSQNGNGFRKTVHAVSASFIFLMPSISTAAIPKCYYPSYRFVALATGSESESASIPVGQSILPSIKNQSARKASRSPASVSRFPAAINPALAVSAPSKVFYGENGKALSPDVIITYNQVKAAEKPLDVSEHIPMDMKPTNSSMEVLTQVADRSLTTFFNSPTVRESTLGQTATSVENSMKQEMVVGGDDPASIQHKFNFNVQAFQALAQVQYSGFTNAALKYKLTENKMAVEIFEKVASNKDLIFSQSIGSSDQVSEVNFRWTF